MSVNFDACWVSELGIVAMAVVAGTWEFGGTVWCSLLSLETRRHFKKGSLSKHAASNMVTDTTMHSQSPRPAESVDGTPC
ncbi:hypothetical protein BDR03DRAFT_957381 [Suillus americanus]|nr:hypothetical protein BDR03DRAFT_957381 [Suillus americanus]